MSPKCCGLSICPTYSLVLVHVCLSAQNFFRPEYDPSANTCIYESASIEYLELTVSCFSITRWEDKETPRFDLDSSVMNHLEN